MKTINTSLLSSDERRAIYDIPIFSASEREYYFTINHQEMKFIRSLDNIEDAVYFVISLAAIQATINENMKKIEEAHKNLLKNYLSNGQA